VIINGTATHTPDDLVFVSLLLENGRVLFEGFAPVGSFGYWELPLIVPIDATGPAQITASFGLPGDEGYRQTETQVIIGSSS
jgi:hypothetical protein